MASGVWGPGARWKLVGATVGTSTLTTAYLMRPPMIAPEATAASVAPPVEPRPAVVRVAPAPKRHAAVPAVPPRVVPAVADARATPVRDREPLHVPVTPGVLTPTVDTPPAPQTVAQAGAPSSTASLPADCNTGGDRARRIAKPGALGAVLGAGLGAAGGAMASGGKGAGKGALIGGLAGAALGTGYGAYTTKNECGTIFGGETPRTGPRATQPAGSRATREEAMAPFQSTAPRAERIQIYDVR